MHGFDLEQLVSELDTGTQAHLEWSRRILRCAVLHTSPGDDILKDDAHTLCRFGRWFGQERSKFEALDANRTGSLETQHQWMHDAARNICARTLEGKPGAADDLEAFETAQRQLIDHLAHFKTLAVSRSSQIDALTGLPLRNRMEQEFDLLTRQNRRRGGAQVIMIADVDHFKAINDRHGHAAGDAILKQLALTLKKVLRADDLIYRYGGEEFVLLMRLPTTESAIEPAARRVLETVRALSVALPSAAIVRPSVTIGIALVASEESLASVVQRADAALYEGKAFGRDRYVIAESDMNAL